MSSLMAELELEDYRVASSSAASLLEPDEKTMREMAGASLDHILAHIRGLSSSPANESSRGREFAHCMQEA